MKQTLRVLFVAGTLIALLTGCSLLGNGEEEATPTPEAATATPSPISGELVAGIAPVDSVEVLVLESFPVKVNVIISGNLPDGCTRLEEPTVELNGNTFNVSLPTTRPADAMCTEALEPYDKVIPLNVEGLPAGDYTVVVNGTSSSFTLQADNTLAETPTSATEVLVPADDTGAISGQVWHDVCAVSGGEGGEPAEPSAGCVANASGGYQANSIAEASEPGIAGIQVSLGNGACPSTGLTTATTDANGFYSFIGLEPGPYCVSVDPLVEPNLSLLVPGNWTFPAGDDKGEAEVNIVAGQVSAAINFGWDYQFLPEPGSVTGGEASCIDAADFVFDVTIPDDTIVTAGSTFTKTWQLINTGDCTWTTDYGLVFAGGEQMGGPNDTPLVLEVPPGATIDVTAVLTAPSVNGTYRSEWQLRNAGGIRFGIPEPDVVFWVQIVVQDGTEAPPATATATPTP